MDRDLILRRWSRRNENRITHLPFYGGAKGQTLEIIETPDGSVSTKILQTKFAEIDKPESQFAKDIRDIHRAALEIIRLHEQTKHKQRLNDEERERYDKGIERLNLSSKNLAQMQTNIEEDDTEQRSNLQFWFEKKKNKFGGSSIKVGGEKEEENVGEEEQTDNESVQVNLPPPDASVAEAKPVGLAVAGAGGVAASKPIATAVVGPGGLAIARPVATAIAGVSPEDAVIPLTGEGFLKIPNNERKKEKCKQKNCEKNEKEEGRPDKEKPNKENLKDEEDDYIGRFRFKSYYQLK